MTLPDGTRGRIVAVAILLIPLILLFRIVVMPLIDGYRGIGNDIAATQEDIVKYKRIIAELPALQEQIAAFEDEQPLAPYLLTGGNPALAAAALQRRLQDVAEKNGARIVSVHVQQPVADGPLERISVQARLQADTRGLRDTLYALETGTPELAVENLSINTRARRRGSTTDQLDIRMTLSGLRAADPGTGETDRG